MINTCISRKLFLKGIKKKKKCPLGLESTCRQNLTKRNKLEMRSVTLPTVIYW